MKEFIRRLGKKVQELLDRIFGKEESEKKYENQYYATVMAEDNEELKVALENLRVTLENADWGQISRNIETQLTIENPSWTKNELKNFFNIPLTLLPKHIPVKTLLVSLAANQQNDYQAVDMSQYEKKGLAHFIIGRTCGLEELLEEYFAEQEYGSEEEKQEDKEWLEEMLSEAEDGLFSTCLGKAMLLHYEELGVWSFETGDD